MVGGTLLPAFLGVGIVSLFSKEPISAKSAKYIIVFGALSVIGGYFSAQVIKRAAVPTIVEKKVAVPVAVPTPQPSPVPLSFNEAVA